ncbi:MAG: hypothetical protein ISS81_07660 [Candidatus Marinimicrobia bacterium]|nr:hypothetical protein [Candidatus Neomarinimicrobiota bacterium]
MNRLNFLIEWYHKENERRTSLNNSLNIPIGILTGLFALIFFLIKEFDFENEINNWIYYSFILFLIISIIFWLLVVFNLFRSYNKLFKGYEYDGLPFATQLDEQYKGLETYVEQYRDLLDKDITPDSLYEEQLIAMLSEYINTNVDNNDTKSEYLHIAKQFLFGCIISIIICTIPFIINFLEHKDKIHKVQLENIESVNDKIETINVNNLKI